MALHHFADLDRALSEVTRVLKPGGSYVVVEVEPGSPLGRLFRFFGKLFGERMQIMTEGQLLSRLEGAAGLRVTRSVGLGSRYLVQLTKS